MSAEDLALFLRKKMGEQRTTNTEIVRRVSISRRTWYRLLNADIEEAKLSTLIKLANALDVSVTQLVQIYFNNRSFGTKSGKQDGVLTNLPRNSLVAAGQSFLKTWDVKNTSREHWIGLTLRCIDDALEVKVIGSQSEDSIAAPCLEPKCLEVSIPDTRMGDTVSISVSFLAPEQLGATVSHWRFFRGDQLLEGVAYPLLDCMVSVTADPSYPVGSETELFLNESV